MTDLVSFYMEKIKLILMKFGSIDTTAEASNFESIQRQSIFKGIPKLFQISKLCKLVACAIYDLLIHVILLLILLLT